MATPLRLLLVAMLLLGAVLQQVHAGESRAWAGAQAVQEVMGW